MFWASIGGSRQRSLEWLLTQVTIVVLGLYFVKTPNRCLPVLTSDWISTLPLSPGFSFFTFGTLKSLGLKHFPELLGRPSSDNPNVLVLKPQVNLLCGGMAGAVAQTIS